MDNFFVFLICLIIGKTVFMLQLIPRKVRYAFMLLYALTPVVAHSWVIRTSKLAFDALLQQAGTQPNLLLCITLDALLSLGFLRAAFHRKAGEPLTWADRLLGSLPCLLLFPAIVYLQLLTFFTLVGYPFETLTGGLCGIIFVGLAGLQFLFRLLYSDEDSQLEGFSYLSLMVFLISVSVSVFTQYNLITNLKSF